MEKVTRLGKRESIEKGGDTLEQTGNCIIKSTESAQVITM
jgi:hypothetical protein